MKDIQHTAHSLQFVFTSLALSILIVTAVVITGVVRTQLKASMDTVNLIHLMGAPSSTIAQLFQNAVTKTVFKGCSIGLILLGLTVSPLVVLLNYEGSILEFWKILPIILCIFIALSAIVTRLSVASALREMP